MFTSIFVMTSQIFMKLMFPDYTQRLSVSSVIFTNSHDLKHILTMQLRF